MRKYKCLTQLSYVNESFRLVPIREEDKFEILTMRNEQIYHLRQDKPLTVDMQNNYFKSTISKLFEEPRPNQLLFSFLENNNFIGYGGLVHINWQDYNAEISFIMKTKLEKDSFSYYWSNFITLIEQVGFNDLKFHKIYTYAFDLRPHLYPILDELGFFEDARLKQHCHFQGQFIDVVINSKINKNVDLQKG